MQHHAATRIRVDFQPMGGALGREGAERRQRGGREGAERGQRGGREGAERGQKGAREGAKRGKRGGREGEERGGAEAQSLPDILLLGTNLLPKTFEAWWHCQGVGSKG